MILSRERLNRLRHVLARQGGTETFRQLTRRFAIFPAEIEAAEALGWVEITIQKPRTGRPSRIVRLSESQAAKLPPSRWTMERPLSVRHWRFARLTVFESIERGGTLFPMPCHLESYLKTFPEAKSRNGAHASCSRLMNHPNVFAARQWFYASLNNEIPRSLPIPKTPAEIWDGLEEHGSYRAKYRTYRRRLFRRP